MRIYPWFVAAALFPFSHTAFAQIEVKQNGNVELGTPGGNPSSTTTVHGNLDVSDSITVGGVVAPATTIKYVMIPGPFSTSSGNWEAMPGLTLVLPISSAAQTTALVTINVPSTSVEWPTTFSGCAVTIQVNDAIDINTQAIFFSSFIQPPFAGRVPITLVVNVPLSATSTTMVQAMFRSVGNGSRVVASPATLSAVIGLLSP